MAMHMPHMPAVGGLHMPSAAVVPSASKLIQQAEDKARQLVAGREDPKEDLRHLDELSDKLKGSETSLGALLAATVPQAEIKLPRVDPALFASSGPAPAGSGPGVVPGMASGSDTEPECGALLSSWQAAGPGAASAIPQQAGQAGEQAVAAGEQAVAAGEQAVAPLASQAAAFKKMALAAVSSLAVAALVAYASLGNILGPMVSGLSASLINWLGLASAWQERAQGVFALLQSALGKLEQKVDGELDSVQALVMKPATQVSGALDGLLEEQKPTLEKLKKFEHEIQKKKKDFRVPSTDDLKKPLDGCADQITKVFADVKKLLPEKLKEEVSSTTVGKVALDRGLFDRYLVYLPLGLILLVNVLIAASQVLVTAKLAYASVTGTMTTTTSPPVFLARSLGASDPNGTNSTQLDSINASSTNSTNSPGLNLPGLNIPGLNVTALNFAALHLPTSSAELQPALVQILLALVQVVVGLAMTQVPRLCEAVNATISSCEEKLNNIVNSKVNDLVKETIGTVLDAVKKKTDDFFGSMKHSIELLRKVLEDLVAAEEKAEKMKH